MSVLDKYTARRFFFSLGFFLLILASAQVGVLGTSLCECPNLVPHIMRLAEFVHEMTLKDDISRCVTFMRSLTAARKAQLPRYARACVPYALGACVFML
jgi:hypothetical protein